MGNATFRSIHTCLVHADALNVGLEAQRSGDLEVHPGDASHGGRREHHVGDVRQGSPPLFDGGVRGLDGDLRDHLVGYVHSCRQAVLLGVTRELRVLLDHLLSDARVPFLNLVVGCIRWEFKQKGCSCQSTHVLAIPWLHTNVKKT